MFLTLGLLVFPSQLADVALEGTALGLVIALVARPVATFVATASGRLLGSRAGRPRLGRAARRRAGGVRDLPGDRGRSRTASSSSTSSFFAVVVSTLLQGATFEPLARGSGVTDTEAALPLPLADAGAMRRLGAEVIEYPVGSEHAIVGIARARAGTAARRAAQPADPRRPGAARRAARRGSRPGDRLHLIVRQEVAVELRELMGRWHDGPIGARPRPVRKHPSRQTPFVLGRGLPTRRTAATRRTRRPCTASR